MNLTPEEIAKLPNFRQVRASYSFPQRGESEADDEWDERMTVNGRRYETAFWIMYLLGAMHVEYAVVNAPSYALVLADEFEGFYRRACNLYEHRAATGTLGQDEESDWPGGRYQKTLAVWLMSHLARERLATHPRNEALNGVQAYIATSKEPK